MKLHPLLLMLALTASSLAWGETPDPPERIARLSYVEGPVAFQGAGETVPSALPDRPLMPGDRLSTANDARAEIALGTAAIRLDEQTDLSFIGLDPRTVWIELHAGTTNVVLRELLDGEMFEIVTPNTAITLQEPGEYRVDVAADGTTALTVRGGSSEVTTASGPVRVADGQRVRLEGRDALANLAAPQPEDAFDDWVASREGQLEDEASRYAGNDDEEYDELDRYGEWTDEPSYGRVWMPAYAYGGWDPFRYGYWQPIGVGGFAWVEPVAWSSFTFYHGRWAYLHQLGRWCWVPGPRDHAQHVAQDTRPFGHPRGGAGPRAGRTDPPRDVHGHGRDDRLHPRVVTTDANLRPADAERRTIDRRDVTSNDRARRTTMVRSFGSTQSRPQPASTISSSRSSTMRSSNSSNSSGARSRGSSRSVFAAGGKFGTHPTP